MKLENDKYEELMIDLELLKRRSGPESNAVNHILPSNNAVTTAGIPQVDVSKMATSAPTTLIGTMPTTAVPNTTTPLLGGLVATKDLWNNNESHLYQSQQQELNNTSFEEFDSRTSTIQYDSKPEYKSGEEASNFNSILSSPSLDQLFMNTSASMPDGDFLGAGVSAAAAAAVASAAVASNPNLQNDLAQATLNVLMENSDSFLETTTESEYEDKLIDMLDIPGKGKCYVYLARYSYDPFVQSLNDNPEHELALASGDYVLIWGTADEVSSYTYLIKVRKLTFLHLGWILHGGIARWSERTRAFKLH